MRRQVPDVGAVELDAALIGPHVAADEIEQRRLAGAVRSEDAVRLTPFDGEADIVGHEQRAVTLRDASQFQHSTHRSSPRTGQAISLSGPPSGTAGASWLLTIVRSKGCFCPGPCALSHWPPTSGVFATFFTGPLPQATCPTSVSSFVDATASRIASFESTSFARFNASTAISNSACAKPIGWVHCFDVMRS